MIWQPGERDAQQELHSIFQGIGLRARLTASTADWLATQLSDIALSRDHRKYPGGHRDPLRVIDYVEALQTQSDRASFAIDYGTWMLMQTGPFFEQLLHSHRRGGPEPRFYILAGQQIFGRAAELSRRFDWELGEYCGEVSHQYPEVSVRMRYELEPPSATQRRVDALLRDLARD